MIFRYYNNTGYQVLHLDYKSQTSTYCLWAYSTYYSCPKLPYNTSCWLLHRQRWLHSEKDAEYL